MIAFRFHLYWAGSDHDGDVRGFFWAVTETVGTPGIPGNPPLPAPKPSDYRYTAKTDSVFIFNVLEETRTRRHAFYLYAVDNEGKADPTPARFIFDAFDRFPPFAEIIHSYGDGYYRDPRVPNAPLELRRFVISDTFMRGRAPFDTVPSGSRLLFRWRGLETIAGNPAVSFKYKFDLPTFTVAEPGVDSVAFGPERSGNGTQLFEVRAVDVAGGSRADLPTTRYFVTNFNPDTWFAGPSLNSAGFGPRPNGGQRWRDVSNWNNPGQIPGSLFSADSVRILPKDRVPNKTFLEIHKGRLYLRAEGDTVNMNSWVLFFAGGYDADSPYNVRVNGFRFAPPLPDTVSNAVLKRTGQNGSPVGFRLFVPVVLTGSGLVSSTPLSSIYPLDEAINVPEAHIAGYIGMQQAGRAYAVVRAVDGDGRADDRVENPIGLVDSLERDLLDPNSDRGKLGTRVLTFYVNRAPFLRTWLADFQPPGPWNGNANPAPYPTRDVPLNWGTRSADDDPYDPAQRSVGGTPANTTEIQRFRYSLSVRGQTSAGRDTVYAPRIPTLYRTDVAPASISVPSFIAGPDVILDCELCDYATSDYIAGRGRCRNYSFPIKVPAASPAAGAVPSRASVKTGPGDPRNTDGGLQ